MIWYMIADFFQVISSDWSDTEKLLQGVFLSLSIRYFKREINLTINTDVLKLPKN